jgi:hypothetical protein
MKTLITWLGMVLCTSAMWAAEIHAPAQTSAGAAIAISTSGSGDATLYLVGPASASKQKVQAGSEIPIDGDQLDNAGRYVAILCASDGCSSTSFFVNPGAANRLGMLVHPSRVPVGKANGISTVAFVFDNFHNLVLKPQSVKFSIFSRDGKPVSASHDSENGVAWVRISSASKEGPTKIGAEIGHADEVRVVQQIAAEACNLRIKSSREKNAFVVETDPVRDCAGNSVPDGTVVSFTKMDSSGKTTVDVPIKRGIAKVQMPIEGRARITVASGVVTGNELEVAGSQ